VKTDQLRKEGSTNRPRRNQEGGGKKKTASPWPERKKVSRILSGTPFDRKGNEIEKREQQDIGKKEEKEPPPSPKRAPRKDSKTMVHQ